MGQSKDEMMFQIEILYDFADSDVVDKDEYVAKKISENFKLPLSQARELVKEYKSLNPK
ncbi:MAG: hypothetical protein JRN68_07890 [Nitrososphaerota archaeon]|nr:hypothetical protein [Nitrososphaerota archaeon]